MALEHDVLAPVWMEDIQEQEEGLEDAWRYVWNYLERLQAQRAPGELINKIAEVNNHLSAAHGILAEIKSMFPSEPTPIR